jgi:maleylpyruvate isomerase
MKWLNEGTNLLTETVAKLGDAEFDEPSGLPGWTRRHVVAHVAANAEALQRLTYWARTGERTPMYASADQRNADIEAGSELPVARLREWLSEATEKLTADLAALPADAWENVVSTAQGKPVPATEIPWMRTREVWIHTVDLDAGVGYEDFPVDLCAALLTDVCGARTPERGVLLRATDCEDVWRITGADPVAEVTGTRAGLARWITGRGTTGLTPSTPPELGRWL